MGELGFPLKDRGGDPTLAEAIKRLQDEFMGALRDRLVKGQYLKRSEVAEIIEKLKSERPPRLVIIHGGPGSGKSGVLLGIVDGLQAAHMPVLPLSLITYPTDKTAYEYGQSLGLRMTPTAALHGYAAGRATFIVDQLDALRTVSAESITLWARGHNLLRLAAADEQLTLIVACRTFDLDNDENIRTWRHKAKEMGAGAVLEMEVGDLEPKEVSKLLSSMGHDYESFGSRLQKLLLHANTLDHWTRLAAMGRTITNPANETELLGELITALRQAAARVPSVGDQQVNEVLERVRDRMERHGASPIPVRHFDDVPTALVAVCSVGLLLQREKAVRFPHPSYFDYLIAQHALKNSGSSPEGVVGWLKAEQRILAATIDHLAGRRSSGHDTSDRNGSP